MYASEIVNPEAIPTSFSGNYRVITDDFDDDDVMDDPKVGKVTAS